jgi:hypothetical protein
VHDFPGYLGWTSHGVIAIHADWPAYPAEHGWDVALEAFGMFPRGTSFKAIDDIDRCLLFVAQIEGEGSNLDPLDDRHFHVAAWHDDLLTLSHNGLLAGIVAITELTHRVNVHREVAGLAPVTDWSDEVSEQVPQLFAQLPEGDLIRVPMPASDQYDNDERAWVTQGASVAVTDAGWTALEEHLLQDSRFQSNFVSESKG